MALKIQAASLLQGNKAEGAAKDAKGTSQNLVCNHHLHLSWSTLLSPGSSHFSTVCATSSRGQGSLVLRHLVSCIHDLVTHIDSAAHSLMVCELMVCMQGDKAKSAAEDVKKQAKDATN